MMRKVTVVFKVFLPLVFVFGCTKKTPNQSALTRHEDEVEGHFQIDEGKIFYQSMGEGAPILVVHGGPGLDHTYLQPQLCRFAKKHKLIFYDQRGSGKSAQFTDRFDHISADQFVLDMEKLRKNLKLNKVILMGHSWGGLLSMHYMIQYPENVAGCILLNPAPASYEGQKAFVERLMSRIRPIRDQIEPLFSYDEFKKQNAQQIEELYRKLFSVYFYYPEDARLLNLTFDVQSARSGFQVNREMAKTSWTAPGCGIISKLKRVKIPTLIIHGKNDVVPLWTAKQIHASMKRSNLVILRKCGHFCYIEKPDEVERAIHYFMRSLKVGS